MIISHKLKCIYIKNAKVAGSSFEIALSKYCGPDDIITALSPKEENMRISLGGYGKQNHTYFNHEGNEFGYKIHEFAEQIRNSTLSEVWDSYLKIATIRCPYNALISRYYFCQRIYHPEKLYQLEQKKQHTKLKPYEHLMFWMLLLAVKTRFIKLISYITFGGFIKSIKTGSFQHALNTSLLYKGIHIDGKIVADFLIRYEHLDEDIKNLETKINCPGLLDTFQNVKAKSSLRSKGTAPYEMYSIYPEAKSIVDEILYENQNQYEFSRKYWPAYKSKLEEAITYHKKSTGFKLKCLVKKVLFRIQTIVSLIILRPLLKTLRYLK